MKKLLLALLTSLLLVRCAPTAPATNSAKVETTTPEVAAVKELPATIDTTKNYKPTKDGAEEPCKAGVYNPACSSIDASNLFEYVGRDDVIYIDLRDYVDYSQKHLRNFEVIPFFAYIYNEEAGKDDTKPQLYGGKLDALTATYEESDVLLEVLFPKDKTIFLMCQGGGRVVQMMKILEAKGYDMSKIYNVGGMGQYTGTEFKDITVDTLEFKVDATYSFEGLNKAK